jgi:hypothetical protein
VTTQGRIHRLLGGGDRSIGGTVYGTILALATLTAGAAAGQHPKQLLFLVATTSGAIWVAHVYSHGLGESIERGHRLDRAEFSSIAGHELPILLAAAAPTATLVLGAVGIVEESTDIVIAFGVGLAALAIQGLRYARIERLGRLGMIAIVAANVSLGLVVVALKVVVNHH